MSVKVNVPFSYQNTDTTFGSPIGDAPTHFVRFQKDKCSNQHSEWWTEGKLDWGHNMDNKTIYFMSSTIHDNIDKERENEYDK